MMNKLFIFSIGSIFLILAVLILFLGENALWLMGAIVFTLYTLSLIGLGFWMGQVSLKTGSDLTLKAQTINDNYDIKKVQAIVQLSKVFSSMLGNTNDTPQLPSGDLFDGDFKIFGVEDQ